MSGATGRLPSVQQRIKAKPVQQKTSVQGTKWEVTDEQLDEALRQTFPASDALSIIQTVRGS